MEAIDYSFKSFHTDKASDQQNYVEVYKEILPEFNREECSLLEVGTTPSSLCLFRTILPKVNIVGIDINRRLPFGDDNRIKTFVGRQEDSVFMKTLGTFDIIIDDASHNPEKQIVGFQIMFKQLNNNGLYIVEDLVTTYRGIKFKRFFIDYVYNTLIPALYMNGKSRPADPRNDPELPELTFLEQNVYEIRFVRSLCIIRKKDKLGL